jgi:hypothetical protein
MEQVVGHTVDFDYQSLTKIGDLVYYDGPLLSVFTDSNRNPYIYYWVEADNKYNRWLIFRTSGAKLNKYVLQKISHYDLMIEPEDGYLYMADLDSQAVHYNLKVVSVSALPSGYFPHKDVYHDDEESPHIEAIKAYFNLIPRLSMVGQNDLDYLLEEAEKMHTPLVDIHITDGKGIGYGEITLSTLAPLVTRIVRLQNTLLNNNNELTLVALKRASFSLILRPSKIESLLPIPNSKSNFDTGISVLFDMVETSLDFIQLQNVVEKIPNDVVKSFMEIIQALKKSSIDLQIGWANPQTKETRIVHLSPIDNITRLKNILWLNEIELDGFTLKGRFTKVDVVKGEYRFSATNGDVSTGKFSDAISEADRLPLTFNNYYEIDIEREIKTSATAKKAKSSDIIIRIDETLPPSYYIE